MLSCSGALIPAKAACRRRSRADESPALIWGMNHGIWRWIKARARAHGSRFNSKRVCSPVVLVALPGWSLCWMPKSTSCLLFSAPPYIMNLSPLRRAITGSRTGGKAVSAGARLFSCVKSERQIMPRPPRPSQAARVIVREPSRADCSELRLCVAPLNGPRREPFHSAEADKPRRRALCRVIELWSKFK